MLTIRCRFLISVSLKCPHKCQCGTFWISVNYAKSDIWHLKKNTLFWSEPQSFVSKLWGSLQILLQTALCFFVQPKVSIRLFTKNHKTGTSNEGNIFSVLQSFSLSRGSPEATIISPPTISNSAMSASLTAVLETFTFCKDYKMSVRSIVRWLAQCMKSVRWFVRWTWKHSRCANRWFRRIGRRWGYGCLCH